jgi:hypothetical protein
MNARLGKCFACLTISTLLWTAQTKPAVADSLPTKSDRVWIVVGVVAIGAAIGIGVYLAVRPHSRGVVGCTSSGPNGLQLVSESDQQTYVLAGEVSSIQSGERVRVSGKKQKSEAGPRQLIVEMLAKDYGACKAQPGGQSVSARFCEISFPMEFSLSPKVLSMVAHGCQARLKEIPGG